MSHEPGPVLIELDEAARQTPATAPAVEDAQAALPGGAAMRSVAALTARPASPLWRWLWRLVAGLVTFAVSLTMWDFVGGVMARNIWLGRGVAAITAVLLLLILAILLREWAALARLRRLDGISRAAGAARRGGGLGEARGVVARLGRLYRDRPELRWARERLAEQQGDVLDGDALLDMTEAGLLAPLDGAALLEVEAAARQVAAVTAVVPLALADVATVAVANLRMIRRIAQVYGGRAGMFGSWRLLRTVLTHLVATGAVAVGDDLIGSVIGGGLVSKLSRRFGEGVVNGALTARVGIAAMEVCRPMPFSACPRPRVSALVKRALAGLFG